LGKKKGERAFGKKEGKKERWQNSVASKGKRKEEDSIG